MEELVLIAKIARPHGIKGEVLATPFSSVKNRFKKLKSVQLRDAKGALRVIAIESAKEANQGVIIKFEGIEDRDQAIELKNMEIMVPISERPKLAEGKAYYDEIIGMTVVDDESNEKLGEVLDVLDMPAGELFMIKLISGGEHLVTNAGEEVRQIDLEKKELRVRLLEEY